MICDKITDADVVKDALHGSLVQLRVVERTLDTRIDRSTIDLANARDTIISIIKRCASLWTRLKLRRIYGAAIVNVLDSSSDDS